MRHLPNSILADNSRLRMQVLVRDNPLQIHEHRGALYLEVFPEDEYVIRLSNESDRNIKFILSIDGCDIQNGQTASISHSPPFYLDACETGIFGHWTQSDTCFKFVDITDQDAVSSVQAVRRASLGTIGVALLFGGFSEQLTVYYRTTEWLAARGIINNLPQAFAV